MAADVQPSRRAEEVHDVVAAAAVDVAVGEAAEEPSFFVDGIPRFISCNSKR